MENVQCTSIISLVAPLFDPILSILCSLLYCLRLNMLHVVEGIKPVFQVVKEQAGTKMWRLGIEEVTKIGSHIEIQCKSCNTFD